MSVQLVADGFVSPVNLIAAKDGTKRLFILDQPGQIRVLDANGILLAEPFLDLSSKIVTLQPDYDERGLLGLAFHPRFTENGRFFVLYTAPKGPEVNPDFNAETHISEFHADPGSNTADPNSERILLIIPKPQSNHNAGQMIFGPDDGFLYFTTGDGGGANDDELGHNPVTGNGQDKSVLLGKMLRIDVDAGNPYGIPPDNPFVGDPTARPEIFAYGLRNPFHFSFDRGGTHQIFLADSGQDKFEEVDIIVKGGNYGWHIKEGRHWFNENDPLNPSESGPSVGADGAPLIDPIMEYSHFDMGFSYASVVVGGFVYRGSAIPALQGQYIFGDFSQLYAEPDGVIFAGRQTSDNQWTFLELPIQGRSEQRINRYIRNFGEDTEGELYVLTSMHTGPSGTSGEVYKIVPLTGD